MDKFNKAFKKGFDSVYYAKVHCPYCKEMIYANALVCPHCHSDMRNREEANRRWQGVAFKVTGVIAIVTGASLYFSGKHFLTGLFAGLFIYGAGYAAIQKIQSFRNFHHRD